MKLISTAVFASGLLLVGCSPQTRDEYSQAGQEAGHAVKQDLKHGEKAAVAATEAAKASLQEDSAKAKKALGNAPDSTMTPKIKAALGSAKDVQSGKIDVTTVGKTVTLTGSVPTAHDKHRAAQIASSTAGTDFKIKNGLAVAQS